MSSLTGKDPKDTYKDLLQVSNSNSGIDGTLRNVEDGEGTSSPLMLSEDSVEIESQLVLSVAEGTAPMSVTSTTTVTNLDSDTVDGSHAADFATSGHDHSGVYSEVGHDHSGVYSEVGHDHAGVYSEVGHDHSGTYSEIGHDHSGEDINPDNIMLDGHITTPVLESDTGQDGVTGHGNDLFIHSGNANKDYSEALVYSSHIVLSPSVATRGISMFKYQYLTGFRVQIDVLSYSDLRTNGVTTIVTEGVDWNAAVDNGTTAASLKSALETKMGLSETGIKAIEWLNNIPGWDILVIPKDDVIAMRVMLLNSANNSTEGYGWWSFPHGMTGFGEGQVVFPSSMNIYQPVTLLASRVRENSLAIGSNLSVSPNNMTSMYHGSLETAGIFLTDSYRRGAGIQWANETDYDPDPSSIVAQAGQNNGTGANLLLRAGYGGIRVTVTDYSVLSGKKLTITETDLWGDTNSYDIVEGVDWTAATDNETTAQSIVDAIHPNYWYADAYKPQEQEYLEFKRAEGVSWGMYDFTVTTDAVAGLTVTSGDRGKVVASGGIVFNDESDINTNDTGLRRHSYQVLEVTNGGFGGVTSTGSLKVNTVYNEYSNWIGEQRTGATDATVGVLSGQTPGTTAPIAAGGDVHLMGGIGKKTIQVVDYSHGSMANSTITVTENGTPVVLTEGSEWDSLVSNDDTATSIANAINNNCSYVFTAEASGAYVYIADMHDVVSGELRTLKIAKSANDAGMTVIDGRQGNMSVEHLMQAASGDEVAFEINYEVDKAAGNDTGLLVSMIDTASPGTSLLIDAQVGGTSQFSVDNAGSTWFGNGAFKTFYQNDGSIDVLCAENAASTEYSGFEGHWIIGKDPMTGAAGRITISDGTNLITMNDSNGFQAASSKQYRFSTGDTCWSATYDLGIARSSANVLKVSDGSTGYGSFVANNITSRSVEPPKGTVSQVGTPGATTYHYVIQVIFKDGTQTHGYYWWPNDLTSTTTGNAVLDGTNYNHITWTAVPGAAKYNVFSYPTRGKIGSDLLVCEYDDQGATGDSTFDYTNNTGEITMVDNDGEKYFRVTRLTGGGGHTEMAIYGYTGKSAGYVHQWGMYAGTSSSEYIYTSDAHACLLRTGNVGSSYLFHQYSDSAWTGNTAGWGHHTFGSYPSGSSGVQNAFVIKPTYNQSATAGSTDFLIYRTNTAVGSGTHYFMDAQVGGVSKFTVDTTGRLNLPGDVQHHTTGHWLMTNAHFAAGGVDGAQKFVIYASTTPPYIIGVDTAQYAWSSSATYNDTQDLGFKRSSAGVLGITSGVTTGGYGSATMSNLTLTALSTPDAPVITNGGTPGATAYSYKVVAKLADGSKTLASSAGSTATGNATLDADNYNIITWSAVTGAHTYDVYRSASAGNPASTGLLFTSVSSPQHDHGEAAAGAEPTKNTSGILTASAGTADSPSIKATGMNGTGIYAGGGGEMAFASGGAACAWQATGGSPFVILNGLFVSGSQLGAWDTSFQRKDAGIFSVETTGSVYGALQLDANARYYADTVTLSDNVATDVLDIALVDTKMLGVTIHYTVKCVDATPNYQVEQGTVNVLAFNKGGTTTTSVASSATQLLGSGTLTTAWTAVDGTNKVTIKLNANSSLTPSSLTVVYQAFINHDGAVTKKT